MPRWLKDPYQFASLPAELLSVEPQAVATLQSVDPSPPAEAPPLDQPEFDPDEHTVAEVVAYAEGLGEQEIASLIDTEHLGRNRVTLLNQLEAML